MNDRGIDQVRRDNGSQFGQRGEVDSQRAMSGGYGWNDPRGDERSWHARDERIGFGQDDRQIYGRDERGLRDQELRYSWGYGIPERGYASQVQERGFQGGAYPQGVYGPQSGYGYGMDRGAQLGYGAPGVYGSQGRGFVGGGYGYPGSFGGPGIYGGQGEIGPVHFGQGHFGQGHFGAPGPMGMPGSFAGPVGYGPPRGYGSDERGVWGSYGAQSNEWSPRGPGRGFGGGDQGWMPRGFADPIRRGRAPKSYQRSDERIKEDLCDRLMHGWVDAENVEVRVSSGEVTLTGVVEDRQAKHVIEDVAEQILGVREVLNQIRVQPREESHHSHGQSSTTGTTTPRKPTA